MATAAGGSPRDTAAVGIRAKGRTAWFPARQDYTSETKPFFLTSEFLVFILYEMGLGIAASTSPSIDARLFWILSTIAVVGYMLSRGIAKAATRSRVRDPREDIDLGRDN
jgi:hypothetical protein